MGATRHDLAQVDGLEGEAMTPEELKREDEFLEAQAKAIREHIERKRVDGWKRITLVCAAEPEKVR